MEPMKKPEEKIQEYEQITQKMEQDILKLQEWKEHAQKISIDFEEYKQIAAKENQRIIQNANTSLIEKIIPVVENFERALQYFQTNQINSEMKMVVKGVEMIYQSFIQVLESEGLKPIPAEVGTQFNPYEHEVVEKKETNEFEEYAIIEVVEKGYLFHSKILKPARVKIAIPVQQEPTKTTEE